MTLKPDLDSTQIPSLSTEPTRMKLMRRLKAHEPDKIDESLLSEEDKSY